MIIQYYFNTTIKRLFHLYSKFKRDYGNNLELVGSEGGLYKISGLEEELKSVAYRNKNAHANGKNHKARRRLGNKWKQRGGKRTNSKERKRKSEK